MFETGPAGFPALPQSPLSVPPFDDEFDLDIRLGAAGGRKPHDICVGTEDGTTCAAECAGDTDDCETLNCGTEVGPNCVRPTEAATCVTCNKCNTVGQKTCVNTQCEQHTCGQANTCVNTQCQQATCVNTQCEQHTCVQTQCEQKTCNTCNTECKQHTCGVTQCVQETCVACTHVTCSGPACRL